MNYNRNKNKFNRMINKIKKDLKIVIKIYKIKFNKTKMIK